MDDYLCYSVAHISHLVHWNYFGLYLEVQEWLYTDGEDAKAAEFQERLDMLKAIGGPIFFRYVFRFFINFVSTCWNLVWYAALIVVRYDELTARPAALEYARKYLTELQQVNLICSKI